MLGRVLAAGGLLDPKTLIGDVGIWGIFLVIFAESGLLIGFFLPGDSLLFTAGFLASGPSSVPDELHLSLPLLLVGCFVAAVAGDQVGYLMGRRVGPAIFRRPDSRFFKQDNVDKAQAFFDKYGAKTIVLARFVPVVRTFAPIVAGVSRMNYRTFVTFNVVGGFAWSIGITLLGYFLGQVEVIEQNLELAILSIVAISVVPIALELWKAHKERRSVALDVAHDLLDPDLEELAEEAVHPDGHID
jgi:membrane-associated protein